MSQHPDDRPATVEAFRSMLASSETQPVTTTVRPMPLIPAYTWRGALTRPSPSSGQRIRPDCSIALRHLLAVVGAAVPSHHPGREIAALISSPLDPYDRVCSLLVASSSARSSRGSRQSKDIRPPSRVTIAAIQS